MRSDHEKLERLERKVDQIQIDLERFATKQDLERFATKQDLERFATKQDLERFATKQDLERFATRQDLERFATKQDLERFATEQDLGQLYATVRQDIYNLRRELKAEMTSHFGAMEERMAHLFDVVLEGMRSRLTLSEAEVVFVKRSELPDGLLI